MNPESRSGESAQGDVFSENPLRIDTEAGGGGGGGRGGAQKGKFVGLLTQG